LSDQPSDLLTLRAGPQALAHLRERGLQRDDVRVLAGAAGGPKWLMLSTLDRYMFGEWLAGRTQPLDLVGSSIGAWRFAAACHPEPVNAIERLERAYVEQSYSEKPSRTEITRTIGGILDTFLDRAGIEGVVDHPTFRLHAITVRARTLTNSERRPSLMAGSALAAGANAVSRRLVGRFFERVVFHHGDTSPLRYVDERVPTDHVPLSRDNARAAVLASGTVPLVMASQVSPAGATPGLYRDGGLVDYHMDQPFTDEGLVLMPHFAISITPGWFDKFLPWRRRARFAARTVMIGPSRRFLDSLPGGKVPDRKDFHAYAGDDATRIRHWWEAVAAGERFADAVRAVLDDAEPARYFQPLYE